MASSWRWAESGFEVTRSICASPPGCHGGCGVLLCSRNGRLVRVEGDPSNPFNAGRLCPRGLATPFSLADPDRLKAPVVRLGPRGSNRWESISWDRALEMAASILGEARDSAGADSVVFCKGTGRDIGPYLSSLAFGFGSPNYFALGPGTGSACLMPRMAASAAVIGDFPVADCSQFFADRWDARQWRLPECILIWGSNPMWSNPDGFLGSWVSECELRGTSLIVVDPRKTWLAARARVHLQIRPGTDGALALGMLRAILSSGSFDAEFVRCWTYGVEALRERVSPWSAAVTASTCGVEAGAIEAASHLFASSRPASIHWGVSVDMSASAIGTAHALASLMAVTGNLDAPGGNVIVRDPFGIPRRGKSTKPSSTALGLDRWPLLGLGSPYAHADALLQSLEGGGRPPIRAAWIQGTNTFVSSFADPARAAGLLGRIPAAIVVDPFLSPTAVAMADLVLPPAMFPERNGIRNWWYMLATINKAVEPPGGMLSDMEILLETGRRVAPGSFPWQTAEEWFDSILEPSGRSWQELREEGFAMPGTGYRRYSDGSLREDGLPGFRTPSGKVELRSSTLESMGLDPLPWWEEPRVGPVSGRDIAERYPLVLTTGARTPVFFHSEHRSVPCLRERNPVPFVDLHPLQAAAQGLSGGDRVILESPWGAAEATVRLDPSMREDTAGAQHGWWLPEEQRSFPGLHPSAFTLNVNSLFPEGLQASNGLGYPFRSLLCRIVRAGSGSPPERSVVIPAEEPAPPALVVDEGRCCGCTACEIACLVQHGMDRGISGVRVSRKADGAFRPGWTALCDGCAGRPGVPSCAANCPTRCISAVVSGMVPDA